MENKDKAAEEMRAMVDIETPSGFRCSLSRAKMDDWNLAKVAVRAQKGDREAGVEYIDYVLRRTLDAETARRLEEYCTEDDGRVSFSRLANEVGAIFTAFGSSSKN